jgi:hypothetical protein
LDDKPIPGQVDFTGRSHAQFERFFDGLHLLPPGVRVISPWRQSEHEDAPLPKQVSAYGAVAVKR